MGHMRRDEPPFYLKAQLRSAVQETRDLAVQKGLAAAFEMDLFSLERNAEDALLAGDKQSVERVLAQARDIEQRLRDAPDRSDPLLLR